MVPGEHGYGWMPFGDTYLFEPIAGLNELESVALELDLSALTGSARAPFQTIAWELEQQSTTALAMSAAPSVDLELAAGALTAMGMAPMAVRSFTLEPQATAGMALAGYSRAAFWLTPYVGADPQAADATVVVFNANTLAATEYSIAALDVVSRDGELYFVTAMGLVKLVTDGTEKFSWSFSTGQLGLVDGAFGTVTKLALSGKSDGEIRLTVTAIEYGEETEVFYSLPCESTSQSRGQHVLLARDVHAEKWTFKFDGTATANIDDIAVLLGKNKRAW